MKTVKEIYDFFGQYPKGEKKSASLLEFLQTIPEFEVPDETQEGMSTMDMTLGMEYLNICKQMCEDFLLIEVQKPSILLLDPHYIAVNEVNSSNPEEFVRELEYGLYDFKYRGPAYTRSIFEKSVLPIVGINRSTGKEDIGTCYYIGNNRFVTAAHCVKGLECFNLLLPDGSPLELISVSYANGKDTNDYDLAVIEVSGIPIDIKAFQLDEPAVLDEVLTMGYPPIPGLDFVQVAETAKVANFVSAKQIASVGEVTAEAGSYLTRMDYFVITARVKGGNSGGPVIHNGRVVGTVVWIPFDNQNGSDGARYDIMGYGVCLPAKYITELLDNPEVHELVLNNDSYVEC